MGYVQLTEHIHEGHIKSSNTHKLLFHWHSYLAVTVSVNDTPHSFQKFQYSMLNIHNLGLLFDYHENATV